MAAPRAAATAGQAVRRGFLCHHGIAALRPMAVCLGLLLAALPRPSVASDIAGTVARVVDGDTFRLRGVGPAIRVWGLDAPERAERGGPAATRALSDMIAGERLACRVVDVDRYKRLVALCQLADGRDIAAEMIAAGVATEYCRYSRGYYGTC